VKIDVFFTIPQIREELLLKAEVILIDVLRATTTICHAMAAGCDSLIPVADLGEATSFVEVLDRKSLVLGGEKDGLKITEFDLGNSPLEYTPNVVGGKTLVLLSSNGSRALTRMRHLDRVLIASFANLGTVVNGISAERDIVICCSGSADQFCLEDSVCAGMLINQLQQRFDSTTLELNDAARVGRILFEKYQNDLLTCFRESVHGRHLISIGMDQDLEVCSRINSLDNLPVFSKDRITLQQVSDPDFSSDEASSKGN
jgi:2-phosphosulfolactate phosphatase